MSNLVEIELINIQPETADITTFQFAKQNLQWHAGQYMAFLLPQVSPILQQYEHWFTISSAPHQSTLDISVRRSHSPFKQALFSLQPGDRIQTHTIDGDFRWPEDSAVHPLLVAGGMGITPFMSMLRQQDYKRMSIAARLHFFNRPGCQIPFRSELDALSQKHQGLVIHYHFEKPLALSPILSVAPIPPDTLVFLAGPPPMIDRLNAELNQKKIETKLDWYFGYDVTSY